MESVANIVQDAVDRSRAGNLDRAEEHYRKILDLEPGNPAILHLLGALAHQKGRHCDALNLIEQAIAANPTVPEFHYALGVVLQDAGGAEESLTAYRRAIMLKPDYAEAYNNMAMAIESNGDCLLAVAYYQRAAQLAPDCGDIHYNLANALRSEGRLEEALDGYRRAIDLKPDYVEAYNNLAITFRELGQFEKAIECYSHAIRSRPGCAAYHGNLASMLQYLGRLEEAIAHCRQAVELDPRDPEAHYNLASALRDAGCCDQAIERNALAIDLRPDYAEAHWNQALAYLLKGRFSEGWREYEWRRKTGWHASAYPHRHAKPRWNGESFAGRRLLVHCEQGIGDCIQFLRYLPLVKALGGTVIFEAWRSLHGLLDEFYGIDELAELSFDRATQAEFDAHVSVMDLPGIFGTSEQTIPFSVPYIYADTAKVAHWRQELIGPELKVGIVWAGSDRHTNDHNRSCRFDDFVPLSQMEGVRLYALQKGERAREADGSPVVNLGGQFEDFADTAAAIECLDLVISVDTAIVHLAGAMARPVWTLLPYAPDWRWMLDRVDSPWYPTMRLFRQKRWGDWNSVVQVVARELRSFVAGRIEVAAR